MRRAVENKCAVLRSTTLIGSDDMTAPSFANQIHMTTGEDRRRSTHTRTNIIIWQSPCEPRLTSQLKSPNRSAVSSVFISRGCHSRREVARRVIDDHISLTTMIPTKPLPNWCIDNICFPIGTLVDPSCEYSFLLLPPRPLYWQELKFLKRSEFYETRQHHRLWTDEGGEVYIQSGSFVGGPAFFNINTVCVSITNENERPSKHTCHRYLKVKEDRYNREFHSGLNRKRTFPLQNVKYLSATIPTLALTFVLVRVVNSPLTQKIHFDPTIKGKCLKCGEMVT